MAKFCGKHDIHFPENGECWNCEEQKMSPADREQAYQDPAFLAKRGGAKLAEVQHNAKLNKLSSLSPEEIDSLLAMAKERAAGQKRVIA
jgi:hypothetical protein